MVTSPKNALGAEGASPRNTTALRGEPKRDPNAQRPISVTLSGIVTEVKPQSKNAESPIWVTPLPIETEVR